MCLGNSLALAPDVPSAELALRNMFRAVRPGGLVIVHVLNLWKLPVGPCIWQKVIPRPIRGCASIVIKGVHRVDTTGWVDLIVVPTDEPQAHVKHSVSFLGLRRERLQTIAPAHGMDTRFFGSVGGEPYDENARPTDLRLYDAAYAPKMTQSVAKLFRPFELLPITLWAEPSFDRDIQRGYCIQEPRSINSIAIGSDQ